MRAIKLFKMGQQYMRICPNDKQLSLSFPEIKIIVYLKLAIKFVPPLVVALFIWQYYMGASMIATIITALFAISLPIQGIFWLGKRASSPLPLNLLGWYNQIKQKLIVREVLPAKSEKKELLNFITLMKLLNLTKSHFGHYLDSDDEDDAAM